MAHNTTGLAFKDIKTGKVTGGRIREPAAAPPASKGRTAAQREVARLRKQIADNQRKLRLQNILSIKATSRSNIGGLRDRPRNAIRETLG